MVEPMTVLTIFDRVLNILGLIQKGKVERDSKIDSALEALYAALGETKAYVVSLNNGTKRDREQEHKLASLWHTASIPLRHIDQKLAQICFIKGGYWLQPEVWTNAKIKENQIALDNVFNKTEELLTTTSGNNEAKAVSYLI